MPACPSCGQDNPDVARFCLACGTALVVAPALEERKVVSVLFADLVGFTSRAEQLDPEDVRAMLSPYYARLRHELERRGGTVGKFIGDAVMALFGAPVAHADDAERAVRSALAIRDAIGELNESDLKLELQVRIAVNTGEALVALGARPVEGEGMVSGDVVNTAARLQTAAPVNGVVVGETTYRATERTIEYRAAPAVAAKGKADPIKVWEVVDPGRWDEAETIANELFSLAEAGSPSYMDVQCHDVKASIRLARGEPDAYSETERSLELARSIGDPQVLYPTVASAARASAFLGLRDEAVELLEELLSAWRSKPETILHSHHQSFTDPAAALVALGRGPELEEIGARAEVQTPWVIAATALVRGEFEEAAEIYRGAGSLPAEAYARLRAAEALIGASRRPEGDAQLQRSLDFYGRVRADAHLREGEALLARTA